MQTAWKTALSLLLVLSAWAMGIVLAIGSGGKTQPIPWLIATSILIAIACTYAAVRLDAIQRLKESVAGFVMFTIFAMIAVPVFQGSRAAATTATCLSNSKQLAQGLFMYGTDFDDRFPLARNWNTVTYPYRKANFICPKSKAKASYAMNEALTGTKSTAIANVQDTVLTFEHDSPDPNQVGGQDSVLYRHNGRASVSFTDGHAKLLSEDNRQSVRWKP